MTRLPGVGHLVERDPHAELLGEHRVGGQPAADPQVEAGAVLGVGGADEGDVVDLRRHVLARVSGQRGLELARQVGVLRVADVAALDLLERGRAVDDLLAGHAGHRGPEEAAGRVAARLLGLQPDRLQALPDGGHVLDADPVVLDVLPVGDVGGVTPEVRRDAAQHAQVLGSEQAAVGADPEHEVLVVELLRLQRAGLAAVQAGLALGVETPPAEPAAQVAAVDGGEAAPRVDVLDASADVERVVVLLGLLVGVQWLAVAEGPLPLAPLGARTSRPARTGGRGCGGGGVAGGVTGDALLRARDARCAAAFDTVVERYAGDRAPGWGELGVQAVWGIQIMLRVRPRSTWRRTTRCIVVAGLIMGVSLTARTPDLQTPIL